MHHMYVPCLRYYAKTLPNTHAKAGQRNAEIKEHFVDDTE